MWRVLILTALHPEDYSWGDALPHKVDRLADAPCIDNMSTIGTTCPSGMFVKACYPEPHHLGALGVVFFG